jgi:hypothetical protein
MGSAAYHSVLFEKIPKQLEGGRDYLGCNINGILSIEGSFRTELLALATANISSRKVR